MVSIIIIFKKLFAHLSCAASNRNHSLVFLRENQREIFIVPFFLSFGFFVFFRVTYPLDLKNSKSNFLEAFSSQTIHVAAKISTTERLKNHMKIVFSNDIKTFEKLFTFVVLLASETKFLGVFVSFFFKFNYQLNLKLTQNRY